MNAKFHAEKAEALLRSIDDAEQAMRTRHADPMCELRDQTSGWTKQFIHDREVAVQRVIAHALVAIALAHRYIDEAGGEDVLECDTPEFKKSEPASDIVCDPDL